MVFDHHHAHPLPHPTDQLGEPLDVTRREAAGRLVEQEQVGGGHQRAGDDDAFLYPVGQRARARPGNGGNAKFFEHLDRLVAKPAFQPVRSRHRE